MMSESHPSPEHPYPLEHEGRIARLEGIVEQIDVRLGRIETKVDTNREVLDATRVALEGKIDANNDKIDATRVALEAQIAANREALEAQIAANREALEAQIAANREALDATREALDSKIDRLYRWVIPLQITTIIAIAGLAFKAFSG